MSLYVLECNRMYLYVLVQVVTDTAVDGPPKGLKRTALQISTLVVKREGNSCGLDLHGGFCSLRVFLGCSSFLLSVAKPVLAKKRGNKHEMEGFYRLRLVLVR